MRNLVTSKNYTPRSAANRKELYFFKKPIHNNFFIIIFLGLFLRIYLSLSGDFLIEKDEVMQYLEQGHRLAYGYGLIPWEYRIGIRSLLIPYFIAFWLKLFSYIGITSPTYYVPGIKVIFSIFSMCIPLGMYQFCKINYSIRTGIIALFLGCIWYELIITAHKPLSEYISTNIMFLGIYFFYKKDLKYNYLATFLVCISVAIRPQIAPAALFLLIYYYYKQPKENVINGLTATAISIFLIGVFEYLTWGAPWISYYLYFYYNIILNFSSNFGTVPANYYYLSLLFTSIGLSYISLFYGLSPSNIKKNILPAFCLLVILASHLLIPHKEYRFIYPTIPFWLILFSKCLSSFIYKNGKFIRSAVIISLISWLGLNGILPEQNLVFPLINHKDGLYFNKSDSLNSYLYLSSLKNDGGILDCTNTWLESGGYYYLHRKVHLDHIVTPLENHLAVLQAIDFYIKNDSARYIITYEDIISNKTKPIKKFGNINLYEIISYKNNKTTNEYNFNRYITNVPL